MGFTKIPPTVGHVSVSSSTRQKDGKFRPCRLSTAISFRDDLSDIAAVHESPPGIPFPHELPPSSINQLH